MRFAQLLHKSAIEYQFTFPQDLLNSCFLYDFFRGILIWVVRQIWYLVTFISPKGGDAFWMVFNENVNTNALWGWLELPTCLSKKRLELPTWLIMMEIEVHFKSHQHKCIKILKTRCGALHDWIIHYTSKHLSQICWY